MIANELFDIIRKTDTQAWIAGTIGGLAGQVVYETFQMGYLLWNATTVTPAAMQSHAAGVPPHLASGVLLGLVFALLVANSPLATYADDLSTSVPLGFSYGLLTWLVPLPALIAVGLQIAGVADPSVQSFNLGSIARHVMYGIVLGFVYPYVRNRG